MKKLFIFLLVTLAVLGVSDMFFEYCVNRNMPIFLESLAMLGMLMIWLWYIIYTVKLLKTTLKL
jgi:hypothetical protein